MEYQAAERDEPLTPAGRLFVRPKLSQIVHLIVGCANPFDIEVFKSEITASAMVKHPRFSSLLVTDHNGFEHWQKIEVDIDRHIIVLTEPVTKGDDEEAVNDYVADLAVSTPLAFDKPLWEVHMLMAHNCVVFRMHHSLGDGISLMSLFLTICRRVDDPTTPGIVGSTNRMAMRSKSKGIGKIVGNFLKTVWYTLVFALGFLLRAMWVSDQKTAVSGGVGVELWPRRLVTATFQLDDMKAIKEAIAGTTINDVLSGVISLGLSKYLDHVTPNGVSQGLEMTCVAMVNLRKEPGLQYLEKLMNGNPGSRWGNQIGGILLPVYYHQAGLDPLQCVRRAKAIMDKKKLSLEAYLSYQIGKLVMSFFGSKAISWLYYRITLNTTFLISNVVGPQEDLTLVGNPIKYLRMTNSALAHAIMMHMVSYAGRADLQILVAKDIVSDPKALAKCLEAALLEMKGAAEALKKNQGKSDPLV